MAGNLGLDAFDDGHAGSDVSGGAAKGHAARDGDRAIVASMAIELAALPWDRQRALDAALSMLPQVMVLRLNVRGVLTTIDAGFAKMLGFSADELISCRLPDIARPRDRAELTAALEAILQGGQPSQIATTLLVKDGGELPVRIGLATVVRDLAPDGLIAAVTVDASQA